MRHDLAASVWATFLHNHSRQIWACDFLQTYDVLFRPIFAFFIVALGSREVVWFNVTRSPTAAWVAQQLRNATPWDEGPRFLIRDNDDKFGQIFDRVADTTEITVVQHPYKHPRRMQSANVFWAVCGANASTMC